MISFEADVKGRRLSWRQPVAALVILTLAVGLVPGLSQIASGRWGAPTQGTARSLTNLRIEDDNSFRVLWVGGQDFLPSIGWQVAGSTWFTLTDGSSVSLDDLWPTHKAEGEDQITNVLGQVTSGNTNRLGRLLGPFGVKYLVMPRGTPEAPVPTDSVAAVLRRQLDVRELISGDSRIFIFENTAWLPVRAQLTDEAKIAGRVCRCQRTARCRPVQEFTGTRRWSSAAVHRSGGGGRGVRRPTSR